MRALLRNIYLNCSGTFKKPRAGIHIINAHYVTPNRIEKSDTILFDDFLCFLETSSRLITLQEATNRVVCSDIPDDESLIAFTFDDGFSECFSTIAPILEKHNCNAGFFINSNYIESDEAYRMTFNKRINTFTKNPMNWSQVLNLHNRGHIIGSHTTDHYNMAELNQKELRLQISENKEILERNLNYKCEYFAWPYGRMEHFTDNVMKVTREFHPYIFSGTNYKSYFSMQNNVINRRHIEPFWPHAHINHFLSTKKKTF